ncbi:hypothetical protein [Flavobacterium selenitireducens]|uniref:hypothetical protein n=1 Tax=Flavobacterium selenitireducens TaxID=2722704 RepID=UPI00168BA406|nr:hypothetical protein [Flavobacterium selenitireducens]MBD3583305.1 hypothetical protein [Flavobacterium selenitireducens]
MIGCDKHFVFACVCLAFLGIEARSQKAADIYNAYDAATGLENLNINNGRAYPNPYKVKNGNHQFYDRDDYVSGSVVYNGQPYFDVSLRYDIYHDILVLRPKNISNNIGTILEKNFVDSFAIGSATFVNLGNLTAKPDFVSGYYEKVEGKSFTLYAKHHKFRRERHDGSVTYEEFSQDPNFIVERNGTFSKANSKNDVIALFPDQKQRIRDFYQKERELFKKTPVQFMKKLLQHIDNFNVYGS